MGKTYTLKEIAIALGTDKSNARKYALKNGFVFEEVRTHETKGQKTLCLSQEDYDRLIGIRKDEGFLKSSPVKSSENGMGWFYIIQLLPNELPERIKLGYTSSWSNRLQTHKTTCPNLKILFEHKIKEVWEKAIIDMLSCVADKQHSQEVFDVNNVDEFIDYAKSIIEKFPVI